MARKFLAIVFIIAIITITGCNKANTGKSRLVTEETKISEAAYLPSDIVDAAEIDIVEKMAKSRADYRQGLNALINYYNKAGNNMKMNWAKTELQQFDEKAQYNYISEASMAGPQLNAADEIPEANELYAQALELDKKARNLVIIKDSDNLRLALRKYNQLIKNYPTSDKIDDAAYKSARIYEHFKDYEIALVYYQRTYQWNPQTSYPAKYRSAWLLDYHLRRRDQALLLYQEAAKNKNISATYRDYADTRAKELTKVIIPENN